MNPASVPSVPSIAVTGASGRLGGTTARFLADQGVPLRLLLRDATRAPDLKGTTTAEAGFGDKEAVRRALDGIDTVFMVSAAESEDRLEQHFTFIDAAVEAGVDHIVYTSFFGAAPDATFTLARDHFATEEKLRTAGPKFTLLRNNLYADILPDFADAEGVIRGPAEDGRAGFVARSDAARAAAAILQQPIPHAGFTYELTGPEALTLDEAAAILAETTGRPMSFRNETVDEAYASRAHYGAPPWQLDAWVSTYTAIARGEMDKTTNDVELLTGQAPLSLRQLFSRPLV
ncbi:nucleoside-diphosphate sugar epimerase [Arthrobacter crystallopoietes BAB-32]|uniref:Nucleoside-diphosphate sugar epimerase n=1 Tax=Arthrobacter crystallopoietes BAB-32 TaxID=1246476 RepID=N1UU36_9MICC|nr:SDR family oxidoreductase [Arthrobacter crystallopoietes]EMY33936.1 nucleoside-diphosphate sugar epimerase [Arthrobacter crystallopoietes BAB-32]